ISASTAAPASARWTRTPCPRNFSPLPPCRSRSPKPSAFATPCWRLKPIPPPRSRRCCDPQTNTVRRKNMSQYDVIVVGAGNAALAAAVSAKENGAERVVVIEKAPREMRGGNTHWSGGVLRFAFDDPREIGELLPDVEEEFENFYDGISP